MHIFLHFGWLAFYAVSVEELSPTSTRSALLPPPSCLTYSRSQSFCFFLHFKTSSSGDKNISDMTRTAHAYVASVNILVLMLVLMPVLISQVWGLSQHQVPCPRTQHSLARAWTQATQSTLQLHIAVKSEKWDFYFVYIISESNNMKLTLCLLVFGSNEW